VNTDPGDPAARHLRRDRTAGRAGGGAVAVRSPGGTFLAEAARRSLGLSAFVSIGDRADVSGNDLLQHWQADARTEVVVLHLQGFGNPRKFARIARRLGRSKPVVALKSGHGPATSPSTRCSPPRAWCGCARWASCSPRAAVRPAAAAAGPPGRRRRQLHALGSMAADALREHDLLVPS
jgi:succinyl-CoA synthetase alpha subunit